MSSISQHTTLPKMPAVYRVYCTANAKSYVGITTKVTMPSGETYLTVGDTCAVLNTNRGQIYTLLKKGIVNRVET